MIRCMSLFLAKFLNVVGSSFQNVVRRHRQSTSLSVGKIRTVQEFAKTHGAVDLPFRVLLPRQSCDTVRQNQHC